MVRGDIMTAKRRKLHAGLQYALTMSDYFEFELKTYDQKQKERARQKGLLQRNSKKNTEILKKRFGIK